MTTIFNWFNVNRTQSGSDFRIGDPDGAQREKAQSLLETVEKYVDDLESMTEHALLNALSKIQEDFASFLKQASFFADSSTTKTLSKQIGQRVAIGESIINRHLGHQDDKSFLPSSSSSSKPPSSQRALICNTDILKMFESSESLNRMGLNFGESISASSSCASSSSSSTVQESTEADTAIERSIGRKDSRSSPRERICTPTDDIQEETDFALALQLSLDSSAALSPSSFSTSPIPGFSPCTHSIEALKKMLIDREVDDGNIKKAVCSLAKLSDKHAFSLSGVKLETGELVYYYLFRLLCTERQQEINIKALDPEYVFKAFSNKEGYRSTSKEREYAVKYACIDLFMTSVQAAAAAHDLVAMQHCLKDAQIEYYSSGTAVYRLFGIDLFTLKKEFTSMEALPIIERAQANLRKAWLI